MRSQSHKISGQRRNKTSNALGPTGVMCSCDEHKMRLTNTNTLYWVLCCSLKHYPNPKKSQAKCFQYFDWNFSWSNMKISRRCSVVAWIRHIMKKYLKYVASGNSNQGGDESDQANLSFVLKLWFFFTKAHYDVTCRSSPQWHIFFWLLCINNLRRNNILDSLVCPCGSGKTSTQNTYSWKIWHYQCT